MVSSAQISKQSHYMWVVVMYALLEPGLDCFVNKGGCFLFRVSKVVVISETVHETLHASWVPQKI